MIKLLERIKRVTVLGLGAILMVLASQVIAQGKLFDHADTGFDLTGGHKFAACENCHVNGQFEGTPRECVSCHSINGRFNATTKPIDHINVSEQCENCHNMAVWNAVPRVDHAEVFGACINCHNNNVAPGQPVDHIVVGNQCDDCHSDMSWLPAQFNHDGITGQCVSCHNNVSQAGKPADHINATDNCESCHNSTLSWTPVNANDVDHGEIPNVDDCFSCHNNFIAPGQPVDHIAANNECATCHRTTDFWAPVPAANVDHDSIPNVQNCVSCHDNMQFPGKPADHLITSENCAACHNPSLAWQAATFDHDETPILQACATCHNGVDAPGQSAAHIPTTNNCAACHMNPGISFIPVDFVDHDEIEGVDNNCASCHEKDRPPPPHVQGIECNFCHTDTTGPWHDPSITM